MLDHNLDEDCYGFECLECDQLNNKIEDVKYWLLHLINQLYGAQELDKEDCECCLHELGALVGLSIPNRELNISRQAPKPSFGSASWSLNSWREWNNEFLKKLPLSQEAV